MLNAIDGRFCKNDIAEGAKNGVRIARKICDFM